MFERGCALLYGWNGGRIDCRAARDELSAFHLHVTKTINHTSVAAGQDTKNLLWSPRLEGLLGEAHLTLGEHKLAKHHLLAAHARGDETAGSLLASSFGCDDTWPAAYGVSGLASDVSDTASSAARWRSLLYASTLRQDNSVDWKTVAALADEAMCLAQLFMAANEDNVRLQPYAHAHVMMGDPKQVFEAAAARGCLEALSGLAVWEGTFDRASALKGHELGSAECTWLLASRMFHNSDGSERKEAERLIGEAALRGYSGAELWQVASSPPAEALAVCLEVAHRGHYQHAALAFHTASAACQHIGGKAQNASNDNNNKNGKTFEYAQRAQKSGGDMFGSSLALCYLYGVGVAKDAQLGIQFLKSAARAGCPMAPLHLGDYHCKEGEFPDWASAFAWYMEGHHCKSLLCSLAIANCYARGLGVPVDLELADSYFQDAVLRGYIRSDRFTSECGELARFLQTSQTTEAAANVDAIPSAGGGSTALPTDRMSLDVLAALDVVPAPHPILYIVAEFVGASSCDS